MNELILILLLVTLIKSMKDDENFVGSRGMSASLMVDLAPPRCPVELAMA